MKVFSRVLMMFLVVAAGVSGEVADTYLTTVESAERVPLEASLSTGLASNVAIDIIGHGISPVGVWLATSRGVTYTFDEGLSWNSTGIPEGLPSDNLSAIYSIGDRLWVAANHNELINEQLMTLSDALSYSDDNGASWHTLDFGPDGLNIPYVEGGDRVIYDITGHSDPGFFNDQPGRTADWLFASAFAGGLLASQDGGESWRRIFPSVYDSIQFYGGAEAPSLQNRYFSCVADSSHQDSLFLWAGTAAGIFQYVFAPPRNKLYSRWLNCIALSDQISSGDGGALFVGGENGLTLGSAAGGNLATRFEADGLPGNEITALISLGDRLVVATADREADTATGIAYSLDAGNQFQAADIQPSPLTAGTHIVDFAETFGWIYAVGQESGAFYSADTGRTWLSWSLDGLSADPNSHVAHCIDVSEDTIYIGSDAGVWRIVSLGPGASSYTPTDFIPTEDSDNTGGAVVGLRIQTWSDENTDHRILWTINRPLDSALGVPMVGRYGPITTDSLQDTTFDTITLDPLDVDTIPFMTWDTAGFDWRYYRTGVEIRDVNFFADTIFMMGDLNAWFTPRFSSEPTNHFSIRQYVSDTLLVASMDADTITAMEVRQDTVVFASSNGLALSTNRGRSFTIYRANLDTLAADLVVHHNYLGSLGGLAGDFIPALGIQYSDSGPARVWAGTRPATYGGQGISVASFDGAGDLDWQTVYEDDFAWNFEFIGDTILAATNSGLLWCDSVGDSTETQWTTVALTDTLSGEVLIEPGTGVYGVEFVAPYIWVGTDAGTVRISISDLGDQELFRRVDSTTPADEVYAFPVPFRPNRGQEVNFHFVNDQAGSVTVEIYDFAMNLVARPIDNVALPAGIYPPQGSQGLSWDGYNGQGDLVAVGIYYFKVDLADGDVRWGKLAVIP